MNTVSRLSLIAGLTLTLFASQGNSSPLDSLPRLTGSYQMVPAQSEVDCFKYFHKGPLNPEVIPQLEVAMKSEDVVAAKFFAEIQSRKDGVVVGHIRGHLDFVFGNINGPIEKDSGRPDNYGEWYTRATKVTWDESSLRSEKTGKEGWLVLGRRIREFLELTILPNNLLRYRGEWFAGNKVLGPKGCVFQPAQ